MSDSNEVVDFFEIESSANAARASLLPEKSKARYERTYTYFKEWCNSKNVKTINETVLLAYFNDRASNLTSPTSLWSEYSMLKLTLCANENLDISKFKQVISFLKRKNDGYIPKKANIFTKEEITRFLFAMVLGVAGACRTDELYHLNYEDVEIKPDVGIVKILQSKNKIPRSFVVTGCSETVNWLKILEKYMKLRPSNTKESKFFLRYGNGKCVRQVVGKHTLSAIPMKIAKFLNLNHCKDYTGHSFRRTSATLLANSGSDVLSLKRHGGWKSNTVAEGYVGDSLTHKVHAANSISYGGTVENSSNAIDIVNNVISVTNKEENDVKQFVKIPGINIQECSNCTFNININK
ncbi:hypothetical protein RI129_000573 [Pyrocoelia pectoralis]|uniref:Tyr recombinase domain-containing protein n=1 Tax=Pyrocoelia pectoralis TaxID=417401 RepID=A0AAN7ZLT7_9COLE